MNFFFFLIKQRLPIQGDLDDGGTQDILLSQDVVGSDVKQSFNGYFLFWNTPWYQLKWLHLVILLMMISSKGNLKIILWRELFDFSIKCDDL